MRDTVDMEHKAKAAIAGIVALVQSMSGQIQDVAGLCRHQTSASEQVMLTVESLRALSQAVGEAMRQGLDITTSLQPQTRELGLLVEQLSRKN